MNQGGAFGDYIKTEKENSPSMRGFLLPFLTLVLSLILTAKLISLQLFDGANFRNLSNNNRTKTEVIHAPRGIIFDRNNTP